MRLSTQKSLAALIAAVGVVGLSSSAYGVEVFSEDFESPDIEASNTLNTTGVLPDNGLWVGATQGFGATRRGIVDEASGDFTEVGPGEQAFAFRYTNSGLTSAAGTIGSLELDVPITISFDVVRDLGRNDGLPYDFDLFAWNPDVEGEPVRRDDVRSNSFGTILASANGSATEDDLYTTITVEFTANAEDHAGLVGRDLTIRFKGATTSATIDNVIVDIGGGDPPVPGDTDGDGDIDDADLGTSFSNFTGPVGAAGGKTATEGDTDGDGDVDDADLANSFSGFTGPLGPVAVPEPASLALIGLGGLLIARRRRA